MSKLRHLAVQVPDLEKAAQFYESVFGMERVSETEAPIGDAVSLSDGVMNLTLLRFPEGESGALNGRDWAGLHHFGFVVEDEGETRRKIEEAGGEYFMTLPDFPGVHVEKKFKDINGVVFDVAEHEWPLIK